MQAKQNKCFRVSGMGSTHSSLLSPMMPVLRKCCQRIHMFCSPGGGPHPRQEIFISGVRQAVREERRNRIPRESKSCRRILYPVNLAVAHSSPVSRETGHIKNLLRQRIEMKNLLVLHPADNVSCLSVSQGKSYARIKTLDDYDR